MRELHRPVKTRNVQQAHRDAAGKIVVIRANLLATPVPADAEVRLARRLVLQSIDRYLVESERLASSHPSTASVLTAFTEANLLMQAAERHLKAYRC